MGSKSKTKKRINKNLRKESLKVLREGRKVYEEMRESGRPGISAEREDALQRLSAIARGRPSFQQSSVPQLALGEYEKVMGGEYLSPDSNPYLQEIVDRSVGSAMGAQAGGFAQAGRFGGGAMANAMADAGQSTAANLYGANYQSERDRMMSMLDKSGSIDDLLYRQDQRDLQRKLQSADILSNVGREREEEALAQYNEPLNVILRYLGAITSNPIRDEHTTTTKTTDYTAIAQGIGGALTGGLAGGCWVAAEFYGWGTPDWWDARNWLMDGWKGEEADSFREVYARDGMDLAKRVREDDSYRETVRPMFEWARKQGEKMRGDS